MARRRGVRLLSRAPRPALTPQLCPSRFGLPARRAPPPSCAAPALTPRVVSVPILVAGAAHAPPLSCAAPALGLSFEPRSGDCLPARHMFLPRVPRRPCLSRSWVGRGACLLVRGLGAARVFSSWMRRRWVRRCRPRVTRQRERSGAGWVSWRDRLHGRVDQAPAGRGDGGQRTSQGPSTATGREACPRSRQRLRRERRACPRSRQRPRRERRVSAFAPASAPGTQGVRVRASVRAGNAACPRPRPGTRSGKSGAEKRRRRRGRASGAERAEGAPSRERRRVESRA